MGYGARRFPTPVSRVELDAASVLALTALNPTNCIDQVFSAVAVTRCRLYSLSRVSMLRMAKAHPELCCVLQVKQKTHLALVSIRAFISTSTLRPLLDS